MVEPADPLGSPTPQNQVDPERLLELADWMGMDEEAAELRADLSQRDCAARVLRICQLVGLPISIDDGPGVLVKPAQSVDPAEQAFLGTGVVVSWITSRELDQASSYRCPGNAADELEAVTRASMETMLTSVLQEGGCHTVVDSLRGDLIVRLVSHPEHTDPLYLTSDQG